MKIKFSLNLKLEKKKTVEQAKIVLFDSMMKMHELATLNCPVDTSRLKNSIKVFPTSPGFMKYLLVAPVEYAEDVEFGTDPHYVSAEQLKKWASKVLGDEKAAYPVAKKIAKSGTEAQPFFRPALDQVKNIWIGRFWEKNLAK